MIFLYKISGNQGNMGALSEIAEGSGEFMNRLRKAAKRENGFTLIEAMAATAVLALGLVLVFQGLFASLNAYDYYDNYLSILPHVDEKLWEGQDAISRLGPQAGLRSSGEWGNKRNRRFNWSLTDSLLDKAGGLYKLNLRVSWNEGNRKINLQREAYALYVEKE